MKKAIIFLGPPSSGKGTQADLLSKKFGFYHFDTGKYIEQIVYDQENQKNKIIKNERKIFDSGVLNTPSWVLKIIVEKIKELSKAGIKVVFSGSPRTLFEAFGDKDNNGLIESLDRAYGKKNVVIIYIEVRLETAIFRNVNRLVCSVCGTPVLYQKECIVVSCPLCAGSLKKRIFDNPEKMKVRMNEFKNRTEPIIAQLKKKGYKINKINGEKPPFEMFEETKKKIK
ncbi:nucleoside monophosphate kinase [Patescibacteria group bacterium]|nr:nucleoside monophosphate kinase [Patescibacteria group bacterium]